MKKIGVHGESLGGIAVTHMGRTKKIDYLCADRTFSSLSQVVEISFGTTLMKLYRLITLWDDQIARDYVESPCYKIITFDPKDQIIHLLSSLKYGATSYLMDQKSRLRNQDSGVYYKENYSFLSPYRLIHNVFKIFKIAKNEFYEKLRDEEYRSNDSGLTKTQILALYSAFHRISDLFITMSSLNALNVRKNTTRMSTRIRDNRPQAGKGDAPPEENLSFISDKTLNQSVENGIGQSEDELIKTTKVKSYKELFVNETQNTDMVVDLVMKVIFEVIT